jgi:PKD repeat protein/type 1 glutamine amidotransferase
VRKATVLASLLGLIGSSLFAASTFAASVAWAAPAEKYRIFVFTSGAPNFAKVSAFQVIRQLGMANGFGVQTNGDPASFTAENLARFRAVVFLDTTGSPLNPAQEAAFENYFRAGGGFIGVGSAVETEPDWQFLTDILGSRSASKLGAQTVTNKVADRVHDASKNLPEYWNLNDTYYNWTSNVRGLSHVLTTVSDAPFNKTGDGPTINALTGGTMGADHPVTWCKDYQGGRSYYTNHGASAAAWNDANLAKELFGAITWASGQSNPVYSDCGATVVANYQQSFVAAPPNLSEPIGFDVLPDGSGRVIQTDRRGGVRLHDPATNSTTLLATVPVYTNSEDGLYGPEVDNNFNTNKWVYLYYSPLTVKDVRLSDGSIVTQTTVMVNDPATPQNDANAPTIAPNIAAWDPWIGYFQLSRFKFVDATATTPAHLDLASEQEILRVPVNRGACCHVAGDIDFDSQNNLWMVTGDDTPAGGGNSGNNAPFNGQLTNEVQLLTITGATGGTFTLTFDGQTTAPIAAPFQTGGAAATTNAAIEAALEALSNLDDVGVTGNAATNRSINFGGNKSATDVPLMTVDTTGLTGTVTGTVALATVNNGQGLQIPAVAGNIWTEHVDARRSSLNTNDLRGKLLRVEVKDGDISLAEANQRGLAYTIPSGNMFPPGTARTKPEIYAMGFRNPFRLTLDENDVAYVTDYSPDAREARRFQGPAGTGRVEIVRGPANYGWPLCYKTDLGYYQWDFETGSPLPLGAPQPHECGNPSRGPLNQSKWVASGGPTTDPGLEVVPRLTNPEIWYSYNDNNTNPAQVPNGLPYGTPCANAYAASAPPVQGAAGTPQLCPQLFPDLGGFAGQPNGVGPHGAAPYDFDPNNTNPTKFPPYWDGAFIFGEFTRDFIREIRLDSQNRVFKINNSLPCGPVPATPIRPWLCDNPMDMEFHSDGTFYLLTYGDGFFAINPDAGMMRWEYVKGQRAPVAVLSATPTSGQDPLTVNFTSAGSHDADPGDSIRFEWDFDGNGTVDSVDPNPTFTYTTRGVFVAKLTVTDSSGKVGAANTTITVGNTAPTVSVTTPVDGGTFAFGDNIPYTVTVVDPEDGAIDCADITTTFVLGHDTHGHAQASATGCSGVLPTEANDVSHGPNTFGVISASYTDTGGSGGVPALTTVAQNQIRQKLFQVEEATNQSGTNTAASTDVGGGSQRGGLSQGDWIELNGPFNLVNINEITFRTSGGTAGGNAGTVEIWRDAITAADGGSLVTSVTIAGTANATTYASQTFQIADTGTHRYFLVFQPAAGGPENNFFNLNWVEFVGAGVGT